MRNSSMPKSTPFKVEITTSSVRTQPPQISGPLQTPAGLQAGR
jgi:hypothetical protein